MHHPDVPMQHFDIHTRYSDIPLWSEVQEEEAAAPATAPEEASATEDAPVTEEKMWFWHGILIFW